MKIYYLVEGKKFDSWGKAVEYAEQLSMSMLDEVITIYRIVNLTMSVFKKFRNGGEIG